MSKSYPIPDYADMMTIAEFKESVDCGAFINYDGTGYYATETEMFRDERVDCEAIAMSYWVPPEGRTHVAWFNR